MKKLLPALLFLFPAFASAQTFSVNVNIQIPDNGGPIAVVPITVSGLPSAINSSFGLSEACFDITHTWDSDLEISLVSPDGTTKVLIGGVGGDGDNFTSTCLANNGANGFIINGGAPFTGTFIPMNTLNAFNNSQDPNGTWELHVDDTYAADTGSVHSVSLTFSANPPPDPGSAPVLCTFCACPGGAPSCDLLPDMTASALIIQQQHIELTGSLDISNATPNIGIGPLEVHGTGNCFCDTMPVPCTTTICPNGFPPKESVIQRIYVRTNNNDTLTHYDVVAGYMSFHPTHGHMHVDNWANYTIRTSTPNPDATTWPILGTGTKQSFCLINLSDCSSSFGYCVDTSGTVLSMNMVLNNGFGVVSGCGRDQGIFPGMLDIYDISLNDPIDLTGICNGDYYIVSITDPNNDFTESNDNNNWVAVPITLTQQTPAPSANFNVIQQGPQVAFGAVNLINATSFMWDFGDGTLDSTNSSLIHTYTANGTYIVTFTVNSPCGTFVHTDTIVVTTVGIFASTIPDEYYLNVHPNPVKDLMQIDYFISENNAPAKIELFNLVGEKVYTVLDGIQSSGKHSLTFSFTKNNLPAGMYFLKMTSDEKHITIRIMK
ncbi:MAG: PKD domain-containing protein [Bacteroidia bacterium]